MAFINKELKDALVKEGFGVSVPTGVEYEISQVPKTENPAVAWAETTADRSLGPKNITVAIPEGATTTKVIAMAFINIMNDSETDQEISLKLEVEGVALFNQSKVIGFPVNKASGCYVIAEDASDEVTENGQVVTLEAFATLSAAASVRFQAQYYLFLTYKMG